MTLYVDTIVDEITATVGAAQGMDTIIRIQDLAYGDVNQDGAIDIIDALLVAQYYVALNPAAYTAPLLAGDANADGVVDIIDTLMIA